MIERKRSLAPVSDQPLTRYDQPEDPNHRTEGRPGRGYLKGSRASPGCTR